MDEFKLITGLVKGLPRSPEQMNGVFESDSEIVRLGNRMCAFTIDEFSETEDFFPSGDPSLLGWNLVIATMSDLLAAGATPAFFMQVIGIPEAGPESFCSELMRGVSEALKLNRAFLIGGDISRAPGWRYVGNAIGHFDDQPVLRRTDHEVVHLYVTGSFGVGNLAALDRRYQVRLNSRLKEMEKMRKHLALAIDTSDGFRNALLTISMVNPRHVLVADIDMVPVHKDVKAFCRENRFPPEGFLFGSAGEYELLVGVEESGRADFEALMLDDVVPVGKMSLEKNIPPGLYWNKIGVGKTLPDIRLSIDPRDGNSREKYVQEIIATVLKLFYESVQS